MYRVSSFGVGIIPNSIFVLHVHAFNHKLDSVCSYYVFCFIYFPLWFQDLCMSMKLLMHEHCLYELN